MAQCSAAQPSPAWPTPYYAVIFASTHSHDLAGYDDLGQKMLTLAASMSGYLGTDGVRDPATGLGITISYWTDEAAITAWKAQADHRLAQQQGRDQFYAAFTVHVSKVDRSYSFTRAA